MIDIATRTSHFSGIYK